MLVHKDYKPGDLPPVGYLAWNEWADVQLKAGIKQVQCGRCGLWKTPQELSGEVDSIMARNRYGSPVEIKSPICSKCESN